MHKTQEMLRLQREIDLHDAEINFLQKKHEMEKTWNFLSREIECVLEKQKLQTLLQKNVDSQSRRKL